MAIDLQQKRVLVTRNEPKASEFAKKIEQSGGKAVTVPLIHIQCTGCDLRTIDKAETYEWIVFTSANGVRCFFQQINSDLSGKVKFAVVGSKTKEEVEKYGYEVDFIPSVYNAKTMAPELIRHMQLRGKVLIVHGSLSGRVINDALLKEDIPFDCLEVYETTENTAVQSELAQALKEIDFITFTSPSTVNAFLALVEGPEQFYDTCVFPVGTTTGNRALAHGFTHVYVPEVFTIEGMLKRMEQYINEERK